MRPGDRLNRRAAMTPSRPQKTYPSRPSHGYARRIRRVSGRLHRLVHRILLVVSAAIDFMFALKCSIN
jgi:hypothetical protein